MTPKLLENKNIFYGYKLFLHDSACVRINKFEKSIFGVSLERFTRIKHDPGSILQYMQSGNKLNHVFAGKSHRKYFYKFFLCHRFSQKITKILPNFFYETGNLQGKKRFFFVFLKQLFFVFIKKPLLVLAILIDHIFHIYTYFLNKKIQWYDHHYCHALPSYCFSPFYGEKSLIFVLDGLGDKAFSSLWVGRENLVEKVSESDTIFFKNGLFFSIGYLYGLFTQVLGYKIDSDEGKTEALAAYGQADENLYRICMGAHLINEEKLSWEANLELATILYDYDFLKDQMCKLGKENFAATIQKFLEDSVVKYLNSVHGKYGIDKICFSGGVMANVILNLNIYERTPFKHIYILPCMGDDGTAFGPAIDQMLNKGEDISWLNKQVMPYWGPSYMREDVLSCVHDFIDQINVSDCHVNWPEKAAKLISEGKIIAVFQGNMEFGPRALGNRSILADPRDPLVREKMNLKIKKRPYFQPFCPSILEDQRVHLFEHSYPNKHMTMAFRFKNEYRGLLPSACHIDGTARPQFVEQSDNENYYRLLLEMKKLTGYGVVINTSFNLHGRAVVMTPKDAIRDFLDCNLDRLFIEGFEISKK